ncbi:MAG: hypothetical protein HONBIEJF_00443 [Fimbriimonadaceae bacterium]|nr:hypothetical protein [Fimbriimonadaceae bacterium]
MKAIALNRVLIFLGWAGLFVAGVLSLSHAMGLQVPCGPTSDCDQLASHPSSSWVGIPVAYFGLLAYAVLSGLAMLREFIGLRTTMALFNVGFTLAAIGAVTSGLLQVQAISSLGVKCPWCIASAIVMGLTLVTYILMAQTDQDVEARSGGGFLVAAFAIAAIGATGFTYKQMAGNLTQVQKLDPAKEKEVLADIVGNPARVMGNPEAKITIVEFADALCGMCRSMYPQVKDLVENSNGKVRLAFRHYPLFQKAEHRMALPVAMIAEYAADEGKFWPFLDRAFTGEDALVQNLEGIYALAAEAGLDSSIVKKLVESQDDKLLDRVNADIKKAQDLGVRSTPTYIIIAEGLPTRRAVGSQIRTLLDMPEYKKILNNDAAKS